MVSYPFLGWQEETRLFERNISNEREFLDDAATGATSDLLREAARSGAESRDPDSRSADAQREDGEGPRQDARLSRARRRRRRFTEHRQARVGRVEPRRPARSTASGTRSSSRALEELQLGSKLKRVDHHLSHAANAFYTSGFDEALIVTLDGYGSGLAGSVSIGRDGAIERVHGVEFPHSLGTFYESVTSGLGFQPSRHEGKIVGLAAYGDPAVLRDVLLARFHQEPGSFRILESNNVYFSRLLASQFPKIDVAAAYQHVLELVATAYVSHYVRTTGHQEPRPVGRRRRERQAESAPEGDSRRRKRSSSTRTWATAAAAPARRCSSSTARARRTRRSPTSTRARAIPTTQIVDALGRAQLPFDRYTPVEPKIAQLIAAGKVVARFDGRMEYGPRALGNRSILYHAKEPEVNQWLNQRLGRTEFMPFAPATLDEHRDACYRNVAGRRVRGAVHDAHVRLHGADEGRLAGSGPRRRHRPAAARHRDVEPELPQIITEYHRLTGIPSVINTSFNMHEEPIVCSPDDAIRAFLQGNLDYLAIGDCLVAHPSSRH